MSVNSLERYEAWFADHVEAYRKRAGAHQEMIDRKVRHTMRVLGHVREIRRECDCDAGLGHAMEIVAILHDVGRFPQLVDRGTYDDNHGYNHAEEGVRLLKETDLLDALGVATRELVLSAVNYHNCAILPGQLDIDTRLVLEVVRDADKLDAVRNNLKYLNPAAPHGKALKSGLSWDDTAVSPLVLDLAMKRQLIPFKTIKWSNDFILFLCCWLYDLHFHYSFMYLKQSGSFEALLARLPDNETFAPIMEQLRGDLEWIAARSQA